ncbi:MAG: TolC family protein [Deltaproteobacteria bacterium]|nr:TolC family protein [Deltaproteobacteria bacterium]
MPRSVRRKLYQGFTVCLIAVCTLLLGLPAGAEELIRAGETLDLQGCVAIALKKHPTVTAALNTLQVNQSRVGQAKAGYYPQLNLSSSYTRSDPATTSKTGPRDDYASGVTLSQNIYDFEKTAKKVEIQELNLDAVRADRENVSTQIILGVKQAYYGVLRAQRDRDVAAETLRQFEQHLAQAKGFFETGLKPKFDVTKGQVDLGNARLNFLKAENALQLAGRTLNNAMGVPNAPPYTIEDNFAIGKQEWNLDEALRRAYATRPDLLSLLAKKKSAEQSVQLAKKDYYPVLSGNAGYNWAGENFPLERGWNVGATLSVPLFSGFSTKYQVDEARANLDILNANEDALRQSIRLEVEQAILNLKESAERITVAEITEKQAEENLELANGRYTAGVGNPIEVTDALVAVNNAKTAYVAALYDYRIAEASLEKAMGVK